MKPPLLLAALEVIVLILTCSPATAAETVDEFNVGDTGMVNAPQPFADRYFLVRGRLEVKDRVVVTPLTTIKHRNELMVDGLTLPEDANQPYTVGLDFKMPVVTENGAIVFLLNYHDDKHYAYFRLRVALSGNRRAELIITKDGVSQKPVTEDLSANLVEGQSYRLSVTVQNGKYQYTIAEPGLAKKSLNSGTLVDRTAGENTISGGALGFGAAGPVFELDNLSYKVGR
jgi:hypothetical protein